MRILRLDLTAFGCFSGLSLDLSAGAVDHDELRASGRYGLHVLYGSNEAGKSTSLRALVALLYGIDPQTPDNFLHPYANLRIGGRLESDQGDALDCIRRKGLKHTLRAIDDTSDADAGLLARMLGSIDRPTFEAQFGLNDQRLRQGGQQILEGKGDVGEILFAAGAGLERLAAVRKQLVADAEKLFKPRASNPRINQILSKLAEVRKQKAAAQLLPGHYEERASRLAEQERQLDAVKTQAANLAAEKGDLTRRRDALPLVAQRQRLAQELAQLPPTPTLRTDFADDHRRVRDELIVAGQTVRQQETAAKTLQGELAGLIYDERLVASGDTIRELFRRVAKYEGTFRDRGTQRAELTQLDHQAAQILRELGLTKADVEVDLEKVVEAAVALRPSPAERLRLTELGNERQALAERRKFAAGKVAEKSERLAAAKAQLAKELEPPATRLLEDAIDAARNEGNIEERLEEAEFSIDTLAAELAQQLRRLGGFSGSLADLHLVRPPTFDALDRHERAIAFAEQAVARADQELRLRTADVARQRKELDAVVADLQAPTKDELDDARGRRDEGWQIVRGVLAGEEQTAAAGAYAERFPAAQGELPLAYELAVNESDDVADRLWHSAGAIAKQEAKRQALDHAERDRAEADEAFAAAERQLAMRRAEWEAAWNGTGVLPDAPGAMRDWLSARDDLFDREDEVEKHRGAAERLRCRIAELRAELAEELALAGVKTPSDERLSRLLVRAESWLEQWTTARRHREDLLEEIAALEKDLPPIVRESQAAIGEGAAWERQWSEAVARLGLGPEATAAAVGTVLTALDTLKNVARDRSDKIERVRLMSEELARFEQDVAEIAGRLASDLAPLASHLAAAQLHDRLRKAEEVRAEAERAKKQLRTTQESLIEAQAALARAEQQLAQLCHEAGDAAAEDLPKIYDAWRKRQELTDRADTVEDHLWKLAAPRSLDEFLAAAGDWNADRIAVRLAEIDEESSLAATRQQTLTELVALERRDLAQYDTRDGAARAAEEEQGLLAALRQESFRYARAQVASGVLEQAIDKYRARNQGPILKEASRIVQRLTGGSLERLIADYDDDKMVLVGVRPDGTKVQHYAMSDGTRDQLYLALRLASLKQYLAPTPDKAPPERLPLIVDDILVHFDDDRSAATLEVLAELSHQTQVIFFTHHAHLVELARKHVPDEDLFVWQLDTAMARAS